MNDKLSTFTVFLPGIMGSRLKQADAIGGELIWHEDGLGALEDFVRNPSVLKLIPNDAAEPAGVLEEIEFPRGRSHMSFYGLLRREMLSLRATQGWRYEEFSYDWRRNLLVVST